MTTSQETIEILNDLVQINNDRIVGYEKALKELKNAGLITGETDSPRSCYCIDWKAFEKFNSDFNSLFQKLKEQNAKCC